MCGQESHIHFSLRHVTGSLSFIFQLLKENGGMVVNSDIYARQISFIFLALALGVILLFVMEWSVLFHLWNRNLQ